MPNVKLYIDETIYGSCRAALTETLPVLRETLCRELEVAASACQFAVIPVLGMSDQQGINVEMQIMPKPERTREVVIGVCEALRDLVGGATGASVAVRVATLDPVTYVALK
ncbi:MAG: hypothetical protein ABW179_03600 [Methylobacterium sp.]